MRVLAIGAHADDAELLCAGTLAHYLSEGAAVTVAVLTDGGLGSADLSPERSARIRRAEAESAARVLGADLVWLGLPDGFLFDAPETRLLVIDVLRRTRPDVVFAPHPDDYHPDHRAAGELALAARLLAREQAITTEHPPADHVPALFFMDNLTAEGASPPDLWVDVTATIARKAAMLAEHTSQNDARRRRKGTDFVALMHRQAELRGRQAGVRYAEAFRTVATYPASSAEDLGCVAAYLTDPASTPWTK